jgi:fatty acid desaturase
MSPRHTPTGTRGCATQPAPIEQRRFRDVPAVVLAAFALPLLAAGLTLILGAGGGLYWLVPAMVLGFGGAVLNAWVLLVEIVR